MIRQFSMIKKLLGLVLSLFLFTLVFFPVSMMANDKVFDWIEDEQQEEEKKEDGVDKDEESIFENLEDEEKETSAESVTAWDFIRTLLALAFVVGLLYALLKFINRRNRLYDKNRLMKNVGGISLGQQKSIQLILIGNTYYLVGVGEDIRLLKEITDPEEIARLLEHYEEAEEGAFQGPFEQILMKVNPFQKQETKKTNDKNEDFSKVLNHRLSEIKAERKKHFHRLTEKERNEDD